MPLNKGLFREIENRINATPDQFDMKHWGETVAKEGEGAQLVPADVITECGTSMCVAGWAVALSLPPEDLLWQYSGSEYDPESGKYVKSYSLDEVLMPGQGDAVSVEEAATQLLGLPWEEASVLFHTASNSRAKDFVHRYAEGEEGVCGEDGDAETFQVVQA